MAEKFIYLGPLVKALREGFGADVTGKGLTQKEFIAKLQALGYPHLNSSSGISEFEKGLQLPRDPLTFLKAATQALLLTPEQEKILALSLGMDVLRDTLGEEGVKTFFDDMRKLGGLDGFRTRYESVKSKS